jgi:hypothetical protein
LSLRNAGQFSIRADVTRAQESFVLFGQTPVPRSLFFFFGGSGTLVFLISSVHVCTLWRSFWCLSIRCVGEAKVLIEVESKDTARLLGVPCNDSDNTPSPQTVRQISLFSVIIQLKSGQSVERTLRRNVEASAPISGVVLSLGPATLSVLIPCSFTQSRKV